MSHYNTEAYLRARGALPEQEIQGDRACHQCGYSLRGLKVGGRCPECGAMIGRRKTVEHLMDCGVDYLRTLRFGVLLVAGSAWAPVLMSFFYDGPVWIEVSITVAAQLVTLYGGWIITRPRPDESLAERVWWSIPVFTRITLIAAPALVLLSPVAGAIAPMLTITLVTVGVTLAQCMLCFACRDIASWAHDESLARHFEIVSLLIGGGALVLAGAMIIPVLGCFALFAGFGLLVGEVWYLVNVLRLAALAHAVVRDKPRHDSSILRQPGKVR
ncbi:MAG: hypothetical protein ACF8PN_04600 [Phycisphaerales bacterium]